MQITSDQQFQQLGNDTQPKLYDQNFTRPQEHKQDPPQNTIQVKITPGQTTNQLNLLESQYYLVTIHNNNQQEKGPIRRRFSDFDMLFEMLFRENKGKIFPAFPEKGIVSYVKSKIAMTKDDKFLKERICMVERFLTILLNSNFDAKKNKSINKFLSDKEFDLLKKQQNESKIDDKIESQGVFVSSWGKMMSYLTSSNQNNYKEFQQQALQGKKKFELIYTNVKSIRILIEEQQQEYRRLHEIRVGEKKLAEAIPQLQRYLFNASAVSNSQNNNLAEIRELEFESFCQNQDYVMVIKMLESMEQMRKSQHNYNDVDKAETHFRNDFQLFKEKKQSAEKTLKAKFNQILNKIKNTDVSDWCNC